MSKSEIAAIDAARRAQEDAAPVATKLLDLCTELLYSPNASALLPKEIADLENLIPQLNSCGVRNGDVKPESAERVQARLDEIKQRLAFAEAHETAERAFTPWRTA